MGVVRRKLERELPSLGLPAGPGAALDLAPVDAADLEPLPEAARRYLRFMNVLGRPRDWSFRAGFRGRFRRSRSEPWLSCEAWQYNSRPAVARVFYMSIRFFGVVPVLGRDTYVGGRGRMLIRPLDLFTVADGRGDAYDIGELVTYLNDGITIAPSMLLVPEVRWSEVDRASFDVQLSDHGRTVRARVFVDERGAPVDFETMDRFYADPKDPSKVTRCRWRTPLGAFQEAGDRRLPTTGRAVWFPEGEDELSYAEFVFDPAAVVFNVPPGG